MDIVSEINVDGSEGKGKKAVTFRETPLMSSYLLAFIVGELNYIESKPFASRSAFMRLLVKISSMVDSR
jgi:aminopeptidase 2